VWTAKRIMILVIGLCVCVCSYAVYAFFFGIIDGMPALPVDMLAKDGPPITPLPPVTDQKLELAFGINCEEVRRPLKLWMPDKGIAFAFGEFTVEQKDGLVRLAPFSAALFHKGTNPNEHPEISIIKCATAILTLDRPVANYSELSSRKVIAIEMIGGQSGVTIASNRRTAEKNDDVDVFVTNGNVFYEERRHLIWTEGIVCLTDHQSRPPTVVRGKGLKMLLAKDVGINRTKPDIKTAKKPASDSNHIEKVILESNVEMHFWVDSHAGFLGGAPSAKKTVAVQKKPAEKAHIHIKTSGSFVYDLTKETAWFESPAGHDGLAAKGGDPFSPEQVHVQRLQTIDGKQKLDQLTCDRLDLQFRRKLQPGAAMADKMNGGDKEIESAKATKRGKNDVAMALETGDIAAYGTELFYRAGDLAHGPLTILKGEPLRAMKDGHKIVCKELHLFAANRAGEGQKAWARGPGQIDLRDPKETRNEAFPIHLLWRDTLTVAKDTEGNLNYDLMTVIGEASFIDDRQKQELHGEKIMVWLKQTQDVARAVDASGGSTKQELHRVYAQDRVRAVAPQFKIRQTNRLWMTFHSEVAQGDRLPDLAALEPVKNVANHNPANTTIKPIPPAEDNNGAKLDIKPAAEPKKNKAPIELQANEITVAISTLGTKHELKDLVAKGAVFVFQAGELPGEKRIDVTGQLLTVKKVNELGDVLVVHGDTKQPARLVIGELLLVGPIVTINQARNTADVEGKGLMEMPSSKNLDGTDTKKKNARLAINFNKGMTFDGKHAIFTGGVQAHEIGARSGLLCHELLATLDRTVSFKEGEKSGQNAKIIHINCDKNVFADDCKVNEQGQFVQRMMMQGGNVNLHNDAGPTSTDITGSGWIKLLAKGNADQGLAAPGGAKNESKTEWKLTHIVFRESMYSKAVGENKIATFYGSSSGVEVFHFPTTIIEQKMDPDNPPKDGLYMRCEILEVREEPSGDRKIHTMMAQRNVQFRTEKYLGYADVVKYDERNDIVTFEGVNGNLVKMYEVTNDRKTIPSATAAKVHYNRKTGKLTTEGVKSIVN
jgi:hypothetical protein